MWGIEDTARYGVQLMVAVSEGLPCNTVEASVQTGKLPFTLLEDNDPQFGFCTWMVQVP